MNTTIPKLLVLACATTLTNAHASVVIADYEFTTTTGVATSSDANVSAGDFTVGPGLDSFAGFSSTGGGNAFARSTGTFGSSELSFANAFANDDYFSLTVTPNAGFEMDLTSLTFDYGYTSTSTVGDQLRAYVTTSDDSHAAFEGFFTNTATVGGQALVYDTAATIDLSGSEFQNITSAFELRIYLSDEYHDSNVIHRIDNVTLNGSVVAVPEPSSVALCGLGAGFFLMRRRR